MPWRKTFLKERVDEGFCNKTWLSVLEIRTFHLFGYISGKAEKPPMGMQDLQLPESCLQISQVPIYWTNKMKNTDRQNCSLNVTREETSNSINCKFLKSKVT